LLQGEVRRNHLTQRRGGDVCPRPRLSGATIAALLSALLALFVAAGSASAATDHVVITGGSVVPAGQTAGDVVVIDGAVRIAGRVTAMSSRSAGPCVSPAGSMAS
jgi:hypothetical protein